MANTTVSVNNRLKAYNSKTKQKDVPMFGAKIDRSFANNRYFYVAKGFSEDKQHKLALVLTLEKADKAINDGVASRGEGWD